MGSPRAASGSPSNRCESLYADHEMRQRRWLARFEAKYKKEEEEIQAVLRKSSSSRNFSECKFSKWYERHHNRYIQVERARKEQRDLDASRRAVEEVAECTFNPHLISQSAPTCSTSVHRVQTESVDDNES